MELGEEDVDVDALIAVEASGGLVEDAAAEGGVAPGLEEGWMERMDQGAVCRKLE